MSSPSNKDEDGSSHANADPSPPTVAAFSPVPLSHTTSVNKHRSTILVHQKSPLLIATPPQITRALAYSHPFLLPLNKLLGWITWTGGDPWESFLLLACYWGVILYGDVVMRWAGPVVVVVGLILGMYSRRYSPLSSSSITSEKENIKKGHKREPSEATNLRHQKTLDEIVETLREFTTRCNILLDPLLELTDFLSTQRTATSATTRPALTTLLLRIILVTPVWALLTLPYVLIITTKRIALVTGTIFFTWHSAPARATRTILWRSLTVRRICTFITGLDLTSNVRPPPPVRLPSRTPASPYTSPTPMSLETKQDASTAAALSASKRKPESSGVKFTFILYENQRRWVGLGWTSSLLAYERAPWTDEHNNPAPSKDVFELPDVETGSAKWRWVDGSKWLVEGAGDYEEGGAKAKEGTTDGGQGWIYYDNKWQNGRRGQDGWGRYTRRRKWYRDAELVEVTASTEITPSHTPAPQSATTTSARTTSNPITITKRKSASSTAPQGSLSSSIPESPPSYGSVAAFDDGERDSASTSSRSARSSGRRSFTSGSNKRTSLQEAEDELGFSPQRQYGGSREGLDWGIGDEVRMGLE